MKEARTNFGFFREKPHSDDYVYFNGAQHGEVKVDYTFKDEKASEQHPKTR